MTLTLYFIQSGQTSLYTACSNGHDIVVQASLNHGVQVDVPNKVSDISCGLVKLCNTTEVNEATLVTQEINKNDVCILSLFSYYFNHGILTQPKPCNKSYSFLRKVIIGSILTPILNLSSLKIL